METIKNLLFELIESEGKISMMNFEMKIYEEIINSNQKYIKILDSILMEYETNLNFKNKVNDSVHKEYIRIAEFFASGLITGFESEETARAKFIELFPKEYKINGDINILFNDLLPLSREARKDYLLTKIATNNDIIEQMLMSPFLKIGAIKELQNKTAVIVNNNYAKSYGILLRGLEIERNEVSNILFKFPYDRSPLIKLYKSKGINLEDEDEFSSYQLVELNNDREPFDLSPRIFDNKNKITIYLNLPSFDLYSFLIELKKEFNFDLALRPNFTLVFDGIDNKVLITEALEYGKLFSFSNLGSNLITKLYDVNNDHLWVKIQKDEENERMNDITFEEIIFNYKTFENAVVTSVYHMQVNIEENIISHLDHEYILYTMDEYIERQQNPSVKGTYQKRVKTFKIDNGNIPFDIDNILYPILILGFENKALVQEYFLK